MKAGAEATTSAARQKQGRSRPMDGEATGPDVAEKDAKQAPSGNGDSASPAPAVPAGPRSRSGGIRRVPKPRLTGLLDSPGRNLTLGMLFVAAVMVSATVAYMAAGWSFRDAIYMVVITVYTVGFNEVRPINTPALNAITMALIILGCTGVIFLTGALVQYITLSQLTKTMGRKRMKTQIDQLSDHVIICGFGRIGVPLAKSLSDAHAGFVIVEKDEARINQATEAGYLCLQGDAASETVLYAAGVMRARVLVSALPTDAVNVFITLSARALNSELTIIARGEEASTEKKLLQAGADKVVLPTHIGAERMADMILFEESTRLIDSLERAHGFQRALRTFGIELEVVTAVQHSAAISMTVGAIERQARAAFLVVQINRSDGDVHTNPPPDTVVREGDGVVVFGRSGRGEALAALFEPRRRAGVRG
jgi:voltage-gated potassium channel